MTARIAIVTGAGGALGRGTSTNLAASGFTVVAVDRAEHSSRDLPAASGPPALERMMDVNLGAALWLSQAVAPAMRQRGSGAIVNVIARPGIEPTAGMAAYSLSKAALVHLTRLLDVELRPHGIRVNAVAPQLLGTAANRAS